MYPSWKLRRDTKLLERIVDQGKSEPIAEVLKDGGYIVLGIVKPVDAELREWLITNDFFPISNQHDGRSLSSFSELWMQSSERNPDLAKTSTDYHAVWPNSLIERNYNPYRDDASHEIFINFLSGKSDFLSDSLFPNGTWQNSGRDSGKSPSKAR